jgi:hypothetical protein
MIGGRKPDTLPLSHFRLIRVEPADYGVSLSWLGLIDILICEFHMIPINGFYHHFVARIHPTNEIAEIPD